MATPSWCRADVTMASQDNTRRLMSAEITAPSWARPRMPEAHGHRPFTRFDRVQQVSQAKRPCCGCGVHFSSAGGHLGDATGIFCQVSPAIRQSHKDITSPTSRLMNQKMALRLALTIWPSDHSPELRSQT